MQLQLRFLPLLLTALVASKHNIVAARPLPAASSSLQLQQQDALQSHDTVHAIPSPTLFASFSHEDDDDEEDSDDQADADDEDEDDEEDDDDDNDDDEDRDELFARGVAKALANAAKKVAAPAAKKAVSTAKTAVKASAPAAKKAATVASKPARSAAKPATVRQAAKADAKPAARKAPSTAAKQPARRVQQQSSSSARRTATLPAKNAATGGRKAPSNRQQRTSSSSSSAARKMAPSTRKPFTSAAAPGSRNGNGRGKQAITRPARKASNAVPRTSRKASNALPRTSRKASNASPHTGHAAQQNQQKQKSKPATGGAHLCKRTAPSMGGSCAYPYPHRFAPGIDHQVAVMPHDNRGEFPVNENKHYANREQRAAKERTDTIKSVHREQAHGHDPQAVYPGGKVAPPIGRLLQGPNAHAGQLEYHGVIAHTGNEHAPFARAHELDRAGFYNRMGLDHPDEVKRLRASKEATDAKFKADPHYTPTADEKKDANRWGKVAGRVKEVQDIEHDYVHGPNHAAGAGAPAGAHHGQFLDEPARYTTSATPGPNRAPIAPEHPQPHTPYQGYGAVHTDHNGKEYFFPSTHIRAAQHEMTQYYNQGQTQPRQ